MHVYLIDFENVNEGGLSGMSRLSLEDRVILFFTQNAGKVSLGLFNGISVGFTGIEVPGGKQSLDMHLITYLGYLLGGETNHETRYYIVSNDTDYVKPVAFLNRLAGSERISIISAIDGPSMAVMQEMAQEGFHEEGMNGSRNRRNRSRRRSGRNDRSHRSVENTESQEKQEEPVILAAEADIAMATLEEEITIPQQEMGMPVFEEQMAIEPAENADMEITAVQEQVIAMVQQEETMVESEETKAKNNHGNRNRSRNRRKKATVTESAKERETPSEQNPGTEIKDATATVEQSAVVEDEAGPVSDKKKTSYRSYNRSGKREPPAEETLPDQGKEENAGALVGGITPLDYTPVFERMVSLGEPAEKAQAVSNLVAEQTDGRGSKQFAYRAIVKAYGQKEGLRLYNLIKKML